MGLAMLALIATSASAQTKPTKLPPPLPSERDRPVSPLKNPVPEIPVPRQAGVEKDRLEAGPEKKQILDEEPDPGVETHRGNLAAIDEKDGEVQITQGEEEFASFVVTADTKITIDDKPAELADLKKDDPVIVTTDKEQIAEKKTALKLEVVRLKRTSVPKETPMPARPVPQAPHVRQLEAAIALGAICVPTPDESVLVVGVERDSPAERVGIRGGDFILQINDEPPQDILLRGDLVYFIREPKSGLACVAVVWRGGKEYRAEMVVRDVDVVPRALPLVRREEGVKAVVVEDGDPDIVIDRETEVVRDIGELERRALRIDGNEVATRELIRDLFAEMRRLRAELEQVKPERQFAVNAQIDNG